VAELATIAIVDDHPLYRAGLTAAFKGSPEFEVVAGGANLHHAIAIAQTHKPDMMILDINIPGQGLEAARLITQSFPVIKIIIMSVSDKVEHIIAALESGARGYLQKSAAAEDVFNCLRAVRKGERFIWPEIAAKILAAREALPELVERPAVPLKPRFTERELDVVNLLRDGKTNREIAERLAISEKTVKHHMSVIMQKLQVRNRVEATLAILKHLPK
jgi:two-component system, NarL family, nitrate/nitrite response regulator NarL